MTIDHRISFVLFIALISVGACHCQTGSSQKQNRQVGPRNQQANPSSFSASRIAGILAAKPRQITAEPAVAQLLPESSSSAPTKAVQKSAFKPKSQVGKRQVETGTEVNKPSRRNEDAWFLDQAPLPLQPYKFNYNVKDKNGLTEQYRQETGDGKFLTGSYGYVLPDGIFRHVDYVADDRGFRAFIRTSEPGTANQNPADVVINSIAAPGYNPATISSFTGANSADQSLALLGVQPQRPPLPVVVAGGANWNGDNPGIWNYTSTLASPIGVDHLKLGSLDTSSIRRAPGSIVGTPLRNFSSFAYAPTLGSTELLRPTTDSVKQSKDSSSNLTSTFRSLGPFGDIGRLRPIGSNLTATGVIGNSDQFNTHLTIDSRLERDQNKPHHDRNLINVFNSNEHYQQQRPGLFLPSRVGPDVLLYDRPFGVPAGISRQDPHKLAYDYNHVLAGGDSSASLIAAEERARNLAHLDRLRAVARASSANLLDLAPKEPGSNQDYGPKLNGVTIDQPGQQANAAAGTKTTASSSLSERHHEHKSTFSLSQLNDDANRSSVIRDQGSGLNWGSGHDSSTNSRPTIGGELMLTTPLLPSTPSTPSLLQPPPQPQFNQQRSWTQQAKGQSARLLAPYAEERHLGVKGAPQEPPPAQQPNDEAQQRQLTSTTVASSVPSSSSQPSEPSQPSQATAGERSISSTTQAAEELEHTTNPKAHQTVRSIRMPEDWRTSMMMSDLRHMQSAFGLPQPPRVQRSSLPSLSSGANLAEQLVLARMARVDSLLGDAPNRRAPQGAAQQQASVQQAVAVPANKARTSSTLQALPASQPSESNALDDDQPRRSTSQSAKAPVNQQQLANSSQSQFDTPHRNQSSESLFEAQRLGANRAKLRSDKVSELEKFQQRLKTQQLLLEQIKAHNESKLASKQQAKSNAIINNPMQANEANSHVKYDDHQDNELPTHSDGQEHELASRARRQNEAKASGDLGGSRLGPRESEFTRQLQHWPSVSAGLRRHSAASEGNSSSRAATQNPLKAHKMENIPPKTEITSQVGAQKRAPKLLDGNVTHRANSPNTINLDFINSVTALSMDQLNPFAISSVNPAIQRSVGANNERLVPHRLDLPLLGLNGQQQQVQTNAAAAGANLLATAPAKYFNSAELVAALNHHERHDTGQRMRNLLGLDQPASPTNHRLANADGSTSPIVAGPSLNQLLASQGAVAAPPEQALVSSRNLESLLGAKLIVAPASNNLMSEAANSQHKSVLMPLARQPPSDLSQSSARSQSVSATYRENGVEMRNRISQADNHRFYEVVSRVRQPDEVNSNFQAFREDENQFRSRLHSHCDYWPTHNMTIQADNVKIRNQMKEQTISKTTSNNERQFKEMNTNDTNSIILYPFAHQVGGHTQLLTFDKSTLCKPLIPRELLFYLNVPHELVDFVPAYKGVVQIRENVHGTYPSVVYQPMRSPKSPYAKSRSSKPSPPLHAGYHSEDEDDSRQSVTDSCDESPFELHVQIRPFSDEKVLKKNLSQDNLLKADFISRPNERYLLLLENVASKYQLPCILDLKMGTRQHGDDATEEKRHRQIAKCQASTSASLGVRLCGMQVYQVDYGGFLWYDKYYGRKMDEKGLKHALHQYFLNGTELKEDIIDDVISRLKLLSDAVEKSPSFRFYGTSLLIIHEGCASNNNLSRNSNKRCPVDVRLIDFAHTICDYTSSNSRSNSSPSVLTKSSSAEQLSSLNNQLSMTSNKLPPAIPSPLPEVAPADERAAERSDSEIVEEQRQRLFKDQDGTDLIIEGKMAVASDIDIDDHQHPLAQRRVATSTAPRSHESEIESNNNIITAPKMDNNNGLNIAFSKSSTKSTTRQNDSQCQHRMETLPEVEHEVPNYLAQTTEFTTSTPPSSQLPRPTTTPSTIEFTSHLTSATTTAATAAPTEPVNKQISSTPSTPPSIGARKISKTSIGPDKGLLFGLENLIRLLDDLKSETLITTC